RWPDVGGKRISGLAADLYKGFPGYGEAGPTELDAAAFGGLQRRLGALAGCCPLVLGDGGGGVDGEPVGVRVVGGDKLDVAVHKGGDEGEIAGEAVEFGDDELGPMLAAGGQRLLEFGTIRAFAGLDLGMLGGELPGTAIEVGRDGLALGVEAEAGLALLIGRHPVVGDKLAEMCGQCCSPRRFA